MARTTSNALKAIEERRKKEEERRKSGNQTANTASGNTTKNTGNTTNTGKSNNSVTPAKTELSTKNALNTIQKRREAAGEKMRSGATFSSAPSSTSGTTKKYTDYNTETKNAYTSVKNKLNTKTTIASDLTEEERNTRIKEINSELSTLNRALSGYSRAGAYGTSNAMKEAKKNTENRIAELSKELKNLERVGTFSASELKQFEIDDAKAKVSSARQKVNSYGARPSADVAESFGQANSELFNAQKELKELERQKALYDDISKFGNVVNNDDFFGQWRANYRSTELSEDKAKAFSAYQDNPTDENKEVALAYDAFVNEYMKNNEKALDDEGQVLSLLSDNFASYLAQQKNSAGTAIPLGVLGATLGGLAGGAGVKAGWTAGYSVGSGINTYNVVRGSLYSELLSYGLDEESAKKMANNDAIVEAFIESGETAKDWIFMLFGGGAGKGASIASKATNKAANAAAKYAAHPFLNLGLSIGKGTVLNAGTEYLEEGAQGAVSRATREKAWSMMDNEIGQYGEGNIDLYNRPIYKNADGTVSTVDSITVQIDDKFVVLPSVVRDENGNSKRLEETEDIVAHYVKTGEYLGKFDTLEEANGYANSLHYAQAYRYSDNTSVDADDNILVGGVKVVGDAIFGGNKEALSELHEQGVEGFKTGFITGGIHGTARFVVSSYATAKTVTEQNEIADSIIEDEASLDALVEEGKASGEGTVSEKIATEIETARENGKKVTRDQVKQLIESNEVYIKAEEQTAAPDTLEQAAMDVVTGRNATQTAETESIPRVLATEDGLPTQEEKSFKTYRMNSVLGDGERTVGIADGQAFVTNSVDILPSPTNRSVFLPVDDAEVAKAEFGATESNKTSKNISKLLDPDSYVPVHKDFVDGTLENVGDVRVFTDENGREIALEKNVAEYFEGYNLEATFRGGKPYAIKATDNDGNIAGVAMAVWMNTSGQKYNITEANTVGKSNTPYNVMTNDNPLLQERKARESYIKKTTGFGQYGVRAFADIMETLSESEAPIVAKSFRTAYEAGLTNLDTAQATLPTEVHRIAFNAGKQDYIMENVGKAENVKNVKSHGDNAGFDSTNVPTTVSKQAFDIADRFCKELGVKAQMVGNSDMFNANITPNVGVVQVANNFKVLKELQEKFGKDAASLSFITHVLHEVAGHRAAELAPTEYAEFKREMYNYRNSLGSGSVADAKRQGYAKKGVDITLSEAMDEVVSDTIFDIYDNDLSLLAEGLDRVLNGTNAKAKKGANIFKQALDYVIEKFNKFLEKLGVEARKPYNASLDEVIKVRDAFEKMLGAAIAKNKEIAKSSKNNNRGKTNSTKNLEIKTNEDYNGNVSYSLKLWHTDLNKTQFKLVEKWIGQVVNHDAKRITDTASWYKGRIDGEDLFAIYSTEEFTPTILYEVKGENAKIELSILKRALEVIENERSVIEKQRIIDELLNGNWMQEEYNLANNDDRLGERKSDTGDASVLQRESSEFIGSPAFRNVIKNLFDIQERKSYSLKDQNYLKAVENGDTETAQRMVDEAAKEAGYVGTYYHGSKSYFTVFNKERGGASNSNAGIGFWFTESEEGAKKWADESWWGDNEESKVYKTYLRLNNPKVYETADTKAQRDELYKGYESIDKEMSLYDSIYYFEDGRRYHSERYDYDKSKRRHSGIYEWDAFKAIVKKYDADTIDYYLSRVPESERQTVKQDAERYLELSQERKALEKQITELRYYDAYELFRTDMYKQIGLGAEDANIGGTGKYVENKDEMLKKYVDMLRQDGYDGIIIKNTSFDTKFFGDHNNQYLVFDSNQVKSADPVTYDDKGKLIPLSERFNTKNDDIRYSLKDSKGNTLSEEQQEFFKDSKVRDNKGRLVPVYHGTTIDFNTFRRGDVGYHFGTKGAARGRVGYGKNAIIKEVYINITNPIVFDEDLGSWDANYRLAKELYSRGILSKEEAEHILFTDDKLYRRSTERANKLLAETLVSKGYDGIEYQNSFETKKETTSYIAFSPEQIKLTTNTKPTTNPDIRFSLKDSEGKVLSKEQQEYFKDSKIRDDDGNLLVVYHGSPAKFTVFNHNKINAHGNAHGRGFYFTEKRSKAEGYEQEGGQLLKGYLNITKPMSEDKVTIKKADLLKLIKATCKEQAEELVKDGEYDNVQDALLDSWISNYVYTYGMSLNDAYKEVTNIIYSGNTSDVHIISELTNAGAGNENVLRLARDILGYDGVIYTADDGSHEFVSLVSEQFKSIDNLKPTSNPDIRYSLKEIKDKYTDKTDHLYIYEKKNTISIDNMVVKKEYRNKGVGTAILNDVIDYADRVQKTITLTPTSEFGTKERLKKWYKANGFVENKGKNTDFTISDTMYRLPSDASFSLKGTEGYIPLRDIPKVRKAVADKNVDVLSKYVDSGAMSTELYNQLIEEFGAIPTGENPYRDVSVPQKTAKNKKVSQTVRTILEAQATPDETVPTIEKMVEDGIFSYDVYTDKQAIADSEAYIKEYGWDESLDDWFDAVEKGEVSKELTTMGWALYNNAANIAATTTSETERTSAIKTSLKILDAMVRHQRSAAQALQATRILKKLSPETQLYGVQKSVQALQNELTEKYGDKAPDLKIDEELAEQFLNAKTPEERAEVEKEIYKDIGRQMPSRFVDKWNAWRYLAMLGNPRTHIRNIVGNAGFAPIIATKNLTATAIESVVYRVSGKKMVRGKSLITGSKADRALLKAAWNDYSNVADMISNGGKYNDFAMANQQIEEGRQIFKFKPLEWARKGNSKALEAEDTWFSKPHYAYALAQYCKANNITSEQISRGKAIAPARDYAIKEAQKATYRDTNAFSQMVSGWGRGNKNEKNVFKKAFNTVVEGILPFRKTPANILVRGVEYSPLGLIKGLSYDLYQVSKGKISASEAIDNISAGLTGTGLLTLGVFLAAQGIIRGHGEDEEDEKKFKEMLGHQAYSLELPNGQSITLDWLAPEALPFFVGVNIWETTKGTDEEVTMSSILNALTGITEPMLEMSCLQGLNDLFEGIGYASSNDTSGLVSSVSSAVTSYLTQGIPTLSGQVERTGEENRMTTYTEKNNFLTGDMQYTLGKASAKIPFWDYNQIPYIDAWGRKEASGTKLKRGLNNFLNPAYTSTIESSSMEKELLRLYEQTGEGGVFPERADKYFTVDGERKDLTADEYVKYATLKGEKSYKLISDLVNSSAYKKLSDQEKVKAIKETYDYANQKAKQSISRYKPETWVNKADEFGSNVGNYISFKTEVSGTKEENGGKISKTEVVDIILDMAQNDSETWKMYLSMYDGEKDMYAYNKGIEGEDYMDFLNALDKYDKPTESGKYGSYTQEEAERAVRSLKGLTREEKAILWKSVNTSWKDKNNPFR